MTGFKFHADLTPLGPDTDYQRKRVVFNFDNGWSGSLVLCSSGANRSNLASVAAWPTEQPDSPGSFELGGQEAGPDEAIAFLASVAAREAV